MRMDLLVYTLIIHIDKNLYLCQRIMFHLGMFAKRNDNKMEEKKKEKDKNVSDGYGIKLQIKRNAAV